MDCAFSKSIWPQVNRNKATHQSVVKRLGLLERSLAAQHGRLLPKYKSINIVETTNNACQNSRHSRETIPRAAVFMEKGRQQTG